MRTTVKLLAIEQAAQLLRDNRGDTLWLDAERQVVDDVYEVVKALVGEPIPQGRQLFDAPVIERSRRDADSG